MVFGFLISMYSMSIIFSGFQFSLILAMILMYLVGFGKLGPCMNLILSYMAASREFNQPIL